MKFSFITFLLRLHQRVCLPQLHMNVLILVLAWNVAEGVRPHTPRSRSSPTHQLLICILTAAGAFSSLPHCELGHHFTELDSDCSRMPLKSLISKWSRGRKNLPLGVKQACYINKACLSLSFLNSHSHMHNQDLTDAEKHNIRMTHGYAYEDVNKTPQVFKMPKFLGYDRASSVVMEQLTLLPSQLHTV